MLKDPKMEFGSHISSDQPDSRGRALSRGRKVHTSIKSINIKW